MKHRTLAALAAALACAALAGCAAYHRGSPVPRTLRAIHVPAFENQTLYPMAGAVAAQQLLDAIIEDGTFTPTAYEDARLRTQIVLSGLDADPVRYDRNHAILPDEYRLTLTATLYAFDAETGETLINGKRVSASETALTRGDFQTGVLDALPRLARRLAQNLLATLQTVGERPAP